MSDKDTQITAGFAALRRTLLRTLGFIRADVYEALWSAEARAGRRVDPPHIAGINVYEGGRLATRYRWLATQPGYYNGAEFIEYEP